MADLSPQDKLILRRLATGERPLARRERPDMLKDVATKNLALEAIRTGEGKAVADNRIDANGVVRRLRYWVYVHGEGNYDFRHSKAPQPDGKVAILFVVQRRDEAA